MISPLIVHEAEEVTNIWGPAAWEASAAARSKGRLAKSVKAEEPSEHAKAVASILKTDLSPGIGHSIASGAMIGMGAGELGGGVGGSIAGASKGYEIGTEHGGLIGGLIGAHKGSQWGGDAGSAFGTIAGAGLGAAAGGIGHLISKAVDKTRRLFSSRYRDEQDATKADANVREAATHLRVSGSRDKQAHQMMADARGDLVLKFRNLAKTEKDPATKDYYQRRVDLHTKELKRHLKIAAGKPLR